MKSQPEQPYDFVGLIQAEDEENQVNRVQQRNHFRVGEILEYLTPKGQVGLVKVERLVNGDGDAVEKAPHPLEELTMKGDILLPPWTILRRRVRNGQ